MQIQGASQNTYVAKKATTTIPETANQENKEIPVKTDTFTKTNTTEKIPVYEEPKRLTADQLKDFSEQRIASFSKMLESMFGKQSDMFKKASYTNLNIDAATSLQAQSAIGPGGEWSSDAVSERILDMAKALSGGDPTKIATLKNAVQKGFDAATKSWGGGLPGICNDTYNKVMKGFDEWENEGKSVPTSMES